MKEIKTNIKRAINTLKLLKVSKQAGPIINQVILLLREALKKLK